MMGFTAVIRYMSVYLRVHIYLIGQGITRGFSSIEIYVFMQSFTNSIL